MDAILNFLGMTSGQFTAFLINLVIAVVICVVLTKVVSVIFKRTKKRLEEKGMGTAAGYVGFLKYIVLILIYLLALSLVSPYIPSLNKFLTSLLAGSGIAALVAGVAAQDAIANIAGGIMILVSKPFKIGDTIRYLDQDITGVVEELTLRHTIIRTIENKRVIIPNGTINSCVLENASLTDPMECAIIDLGITYESDLDLALSELARIIRSHPNHIDHRSEQDKANGAPDVQVRVIRFDDSAIVIRGWAWAASPAAAAAMKSDILRAAHKIFGENGIDFAYPHVVVLPK